MEACTFIRKALGRTKLYIQISSVELRLLGESCWIDSHCAPRRRIGSSGNGECLGGELEFHRSQICRIPSSKHTIKAQSAGDGFGEFADGEVFAGAGAGAGADEGRGGSVSVNWVA